MSILSCWRGFKSPALTGGANSDAILDVSIATPAGEAPARDALCARYKNQYAETDISTQQSQARQDARISRAHEDEKRAGRAVAPPGPRPSQADSQRREGRPLRKSQLIRLPGLCVPPTSAKCMTMERAFPARCSRRFAWRVQIPQIQRHAWASPSRARSAGAWSGTASSAGCARLSDCTAPNSTRAGISCLIRAARHSPLHSRNSSGASGR